MEETVTNVHLEVEELLHRDITPNQGICKEIKNVSITAEEITENPEYLVMRRSIAVQAVANEEVIIPKGDHALSRASNSTVVGSEGGNTMEMDISSQESVMDIASQESLSAKESNSEDPRYCEQRSSVPSSEDVVLRREEDIRKREEALLKFEESMKILEEGIANRKRVLLQLEMEIQEHQAMINFQEQQIADQKLTLKKLGVAIKIHELEAEGYKVIPLGSENNGCLPVKRAKKN